MDLLLQENPRKRRGNRNPVAFDYMGNPVFLNMNPRRKKMARRRRNPAIAMPKSIKQWTHGVGIMDAAAGLAGITLAGWLPGQVVKANVTTTDKALRLVAAFGGAIVAGYLGNAVGGSRAGQAAVIGGLASTAAQGLSSFAGIKLGSPGRMIAGPRRIGYPETISPSMNREGENVTLLQP